MIKTAKMRIGNLVSAEKNVSTLQMSMTFVLTISLILSNIMVVKSIDIFGFSWLANTCAIITFPITYVLSDVFSEVYGYKWSRVTATWAFIGTVLCSIMFALMIAIPGNAAWTKQQALVDILGNTPQIAIASVIAFWFGDFINDRVFRAMKERSSGEKTFWMRAIISSVAGKYADQIVFTFLGLSFLPLGTKVVMVLSCPLAHLAFETLLLPVTTAVMKIVKRAELR